MVSILINKDVFKSSYNELKFTVWNCNYICTNLIYSNISFLNFIITKKEEEEGEREKLREQRKGATDRPPASPHALSSRGRPPAAVTPAYPRFPCERI